MSVNTRNSIVTNGLVFYVDAANPMSYTSGSTTWNDLSGGGNNGTLTNGPTFNSNSKSIVFDGVNDYIIGSVPTLIGWTISLWYLSLDITSSPVFYPFGFNTPAGIGFGGTFSSTTNNKWYFFDGTNTFSNAATSVSINTWYYLTVTKTSTTYNLYTNGSLSLNTTGISVNLTDYILGARQTSTFFVKGNIAQASVYNRALSQQEVLQNYNATKIRFGL